MPERSAGVLLYRKNSSRSCWEILVVKPGGIFWRGKRAHAFGVPKGRFKPGQEGALAAARREFREETGSDAPRENELTELGDFKVSSSKVVTVFVGEGEFACENLKSNTFEVGGVEYPEIDEAEWVSLDGDKAEELLHKGQVQIAAAMRKFLREKSLQSDEHRGATS